ncbi:hypothetical protein EV421DRAFT_1739419 [Armillaria borealis]|uniref:Uncharacterized protein n=1 Tax=Armillaria borealis TaxID=47425 RepID=A0AA39MK72_9AGAR|nr:hypothetical protein EV421DRAFT_1739419 [Armillaria borealis]
MALFGPTMRENDHPIFRFQAVFQCPIATSTGSLLATFTRVATRGGQVEGRVKKLQDNLPIAAIANQRNTWGLSMDNRPTWSLEQTKLRDVYTSSLHRDPMMIFMNYFTVFQLVDVQESPQESGDLLMYGVTKSGNSILATITGYKPYLYVYPKSISGDVQDVEVALKAHLHLLEDAGLYKFVDPQTDVVMRFLADYQLPGMGGWIECPVGVYVLTKISDQASRCQIELAIPYICWSRHVKHVRSRNPQRSAKNPIL